MSGRRPAYPLPLPILAGADPAPPRAGEGRVIDTVLAGPAYRDGRWELCFSETIEAPGGLRRSVRHSYYYAPIGARSWDFGGVVQGAADLSSAASSRAPAKSG